MMDNFIVKHVFLMQIMFDSYCLPGNFYRIRSAFKFGAHKLGHILLGPRDEVVDEICKYFSSTRARHEHQHRNSNRNLALEFSDEESLTASLPSPIELLSDDDMLLKSSLSDSDDNSVSAEQTSIKEVSPETASETYDSEVSRNGRPDYISIHNNGAFFAENHFCKLHYLASRSSAESGNLEDQQIDLSYDSEKSGFNPWLKNREEHLQMNNTFQWCLDNHEAACSCITGSNSTSKGSVMENLSLDFREIESASIGGESEAFNPLADLTGDYDSNIRSFLRAQLCHGFSLSAAASSPSSPSNNIQKKKPWDIVRQSITQDEKELPKMDLHLIPTDHVIHACEGMPKSRGLGTYFPDMVISYLCRQFLTTFMIILILEFTYCRLLLTT